MSNIIYNHASTIYIYTHIYIHIYSSNMYTAIVYKENLETNAQKCVRTCHGSRRGARHLTALRLVVGMCTCACYIYIYTYVLNL